MKKEIEIHKEQVEKGVILCVKIPKIKVHEFAMIILNLINLKSSQSHSKILNVETVYDSNDIYVTFNSDETEVCKNILKSVVDSNTLDLEFSVSLISEIEILTMYGSELEEIGIIKSGFDFYVKGEYWYDWK